MDIYGFALKMEKDGESFYRQLAEKTYNKGLKTILTMLADEEVKHFHTIEKMKQGRYEMAETTILNDAKNIFEKMDKADEFISEQEQTDLYKKAQEIEEQSRRFYLQKADQMEDSSQKQLFVQLAAEEAKHYFLLDNIIYLVSKPKWWLENAEWYHLDEF